MPWPFLAGPRAGAWPARDSVVALLVECSPPVLLRKSAGCWAPKSPAHVTLAHQRWRSWIKWDYKGHLNTSGFPPQAYATHAPRLSEKQEALACRITQGKRFSSFELPLVSHKGTQDPAEKMVHTEMQSRNDESRSNKTADAQKQDSKIPGAWCSM